MKTADGPGTYLIRCVANGKVYVGSSSVSVKGREIHHFQLLRRGCHPARGIQDDFNSYGQGAFEFLIVQIIEDRSVIDAEKALIEKHDATNQEKGYNTVRTPIKHGGRPVKEAECKTVIKAFSLYSEHKEKLRSLADRDSIGVSEVIRRLIEHAKH